MSSGDGNRAPLVVESVPVTSVRLDPKNVRTHPAKNLDAIGASLRRFGQQKPIVVDGDGVVVAGNGTLAAAVALGWHEIQVVRTSLRGAEARAFAIADNRTGDLSEFDEDLLTEALATVQRDDATLLDAVGFSDRELSRMLNVPTGHVVGPGNVPLDPVTRHGDLWELGDHRILCGDAARTEDWNELMRGDRATCVMTDPPYGVSIGAKNRFLDEHQKAERNTTDIVDDDLSPEALRDRLLPAFIAMRSKAMADDCTVFVTAPQGGELGMMMMMMRDAGLPVRHVLVWRKHAPTFSMGRLDYDYQHEPILLTWGRRHKKVMVGEHRTSVWDIPRPTESKNHPTMKPVELYENAYLNHSDEGDVVVDGFAGSGTCLVAAQRTRRKCRAMEIAPAYVDVAVRRWEHETGGTALLNRDGSPGSQTFDAVSRERIGRASVDASP